MGNTNQNKIDPNPSPKEMKRRLSLFKQEKDHYEEKKVGDRWYIKNLGVKNTWQVDIYSEENYNRYINYSNKYKGNAKIPPHPRKYTPGYQ